MITIMIIIIIISWTEHNTFKHMQYTPINMRLISSFCD